MQFCDKQVSLPLIEIQREHDTLMVQQTKVLRATEEIMVQLDCAVDCSEQFSVAAILSQLDADTQQNYDRLEMKNES